MLLLCAFRRRNRGRHATVWATTPRLHNNSSRTSLHLPPRKNTCTSLSRRARSKRPAHRAATCATCPPAGVADQSASRPRGMQVVMVREAACLRLDHTRGICPSRTTPVGNDDDACSPPHRRHTLPAGSLPGPSIPRPTPFGPACVRAPGRLNTGWSQLARTAPSAPASQAAKRCACPCCCAACTSSTAGHACLPVSTPC